MTGLFKIRWFAGLPALLAACTPLSTFNALVPQDRGVVRVAQGIAYGSDPRQRLDVYAPRRHGPEPLPVILFFYGGSWSSGARGGYAFVGRALAARGFVTVIPDYRLVPQVRFPAFVEDGAAAVRWVRAHIAMQGGDPARIVLAGHSAGAYNAAMLALDPRFLGRDRVAVRGFAGLAGPYDFSLDDGPITRAAFAGVRDPRATQPISFAAADSPPALLAFGADDRTVRPANSEALAAKLTAAGVKVTLRRYPRLGHIGIVTAIASPFRGKAPVLDDVAAFAREVTALIPERQRTPLVQEETQEKQ